MYISDEGVKCKNKNITHKNNTNKNNINKNNSNMNNKNNKTNKSSTKKNISKCSLEKNLNKFNDFLDYEPSQYVSYVNLTLHDDGDDTKYYV